MGLFISLYLYIFPSLTTFLQTYVLFFYFKHLASSLKFIVVHISETYSVISEFTVVSLNQYYGFSESILCRLLIYYGVCKSTMVSLNLLW